MYICVEACTATCVISVRLGVSYGNREERERGRYVFVNCGKVQMLRLFRQASCKWYIIAIVHVINSRKWKDA